MTVRIGTRASNLAMWQAKTVSAALEASGVATELVPLTSTGDRSLGGQLSSSVGQFIHSIDNRLLSGKSTLPSTRARMCPWTSTTASRI